MLEMYMFTNTDSCVYPDNVTYLDPHSVNRVSPDERGDGEPVCCVEFGNHDSFIIVYGAARVIAAAVAQSKLVPYIVQCPKPLSAVKGEG